MDREKVIKGLEICYCPPSKCEDCPYHDLPDELSCSDALCLDALALVKEQESTLNRLRSTMEDMVRGNASEEISYLLRLLDKWE